MGEGTRCCEKTKLTREAACVWSSAAPCRELDCTRRRGDPFCPSPFLFSFVSPSSFFSSSFLGRGCIFCFRFPRSHLRIFLFRTLDSLSAFSLRPSTCFAPLTVRCWHAVVAFARLPRETDETRRCTENEIRKKNSLYKLFGRSKRMDRQNE